MVELVDLCTELNNWFDRSRHFGRFTIEGGVIDLGSLVSSNDLRDDQYFRIVGSVFNDGVYKYPASDLKDEVFEGAVWTMAVPPAVMALQRDINDWIGKYGDVVSSPYQSESFGGYSYSKSSGGGSADNGTDAGSWQNQFHSRLNRWRKIRP